MRTCAKIPGSRKIAKTPASSPFTSSAKSTWPAVPSAKSTRKTKPASALTSVSHQAGCALNPVVRSDGETCALHIIPVLLQFAAVLRRPFEHESQGSTRQLAFDDFHRAQIDQFLRIAVNGVKMGRGVIREIHPNQDAVEGADRRHGQPTAPSSETNRSFKN